MEIPRHYEKHGTSLSKLDLPDECVIVSITRDGNLIIPRGNTQILSGDKIIVICRNEYLHDLKRVLQIPEASHR